MAVVKLERGFVSRIVERIHPKRMRLRVKEIVGETATTKTFRLVPKDGPIPPFRAGQYVNLFVNINGVLTSRPYSISSPPNRTGYIDLTVRRKPGGFVSHYLLDRVKVGDELETTGPIGCLYHEPLTDDNDLVFLAGGSGITPFMSMIREVTDRGLSLNIHLIYGSRVPDDIIFGDELEAIASRHPNIRYVPVISEPPANWTGLRGFLTAKLIKSQIGSIEGKTFYISGPYVMYGFCEAELKKLGVPRRKVKRDVCGSPDDITKEPGWPKGLSADAEFRVEIIGRKTIKARADEPLMNSLERHGLVISAECRSGECAVCRIKLVSGKVFMPSTATLCEADRWFGYIHPCVSYPIEDIRIRF